MPVYCDGQLCLRKIPGVLPDGGGGFYIVLKNKTGAPSVKGTIVDMHSSEAQAFALEAADDQDPMGVVLDDGVPDGGWCRVIVKGMAQVLLRDGVAGTTGYWARASATVAGRVDVAATPPGADVSHWREIGHIAETIGSGTDVLCWATIHFN